MIYVYKEDVDWVTWLSQLGCRLGPLRQKVLANIHTLVFIGVSVYVSVENGKEFSPGVGLISVNFNFIKWMWEKKFHWRVLKYGSDS